MAEIWDYLKRPDAVISAVDLLYALLLLGGLLRGMFRGVSGEIAATLGTVITFIGSGRFYRPVSSFLLEKTRMENETAAQGLAYLLLILLFFASWKAITWLLRTLFQRAVPDHIERPLGALLGLVKSTVLLCVLLVLINFSGSVFLRTLFIERSAFGRLTQVAIPTLLNRWMPRAFSAPPVPAPTPTPPATSHGSGNT